jgi:hypothetical protein
MDLNSSGSSEQFILEYGDYVPENVLFLKIIIMNN